MHTCNSINTSVGVLNRVTIWRTMVSGRDSIKETTRICEVGGGLKHRKLVLSDLHRL